MANNTPLDYTKSEDMKFFNKGIIPMDEKFDLKEEKLRKFLDMVKDKVGIFNWNNVTNIPDTVAVSRNLITQYGQLSLQECTTYATAHQNATTRRAQNEIMLYHYLVNSLTQDARLNMLVDPSVSTIGTNPSGLIFLKVTPRRWYYYYDNQSQ